MNLTVFLYTAAEKIVFLYRKLFNKEEIADIVFVLAYTCVVFNIEGKSPHVTTQIMQRSIMACSAKTPYMLLYSSS